MSKKGKTKTIPRIYTGHNPIPAPPQEDQAIDLVLEPVVEIAPNLLRAIEMHRALRRCGVLFRRSPLDMHLDEKSQLFNFSKPVEIMDSFISHTWATPGWQKYIVLTIRTNGAFGTLAGLLSLIVLVSLKLCNVYPAPSNSTTVSVQGWTGEVPNSVPLCLFCAPAMALSATFGRNLLPSAMRSRRTAFLDVTCIHQCDQHMMKQGIYGLAAFLKASRELLILWSPPYFSRLWCIYEVAAFRALHMSSSGDDQTCVDHDKSVVSFCPLFVHLTLIVAYLGWWIFFILVAVTFRVQDWQLDLVSSILLWFFFYCGGVVAWSFGIHKLREFFRHKKDLFNQLQQFDMNNAGCREERDRKYIHAAVLKWFESQETFNMYVRNEMYKDLFCQNYAEYSFFQVFAALFPVFCYVVETVSGFAKVSEMPAEVRASCCTCYLAMGLMAAPLCQALCFDWIEKQADKRSSSLADVLVSIGLALKVGATGLVFTTLGWLAQVHISASVCYFAVLVGLCLAKFRENQKAEVEETTQKGKSRITLPPIRHCSEQFGPKDTE